MTRKRKKVTTASPAGSNSSGPSRPSPPRPTTPLEGALALTPPRAVTPTASSVMTDFSDMSDLEELPQVLPTPPAVTYATALRSTSSQSHTRGQPRTLPKFRVTPTERHATSYAAVAALERENPSVKISCRFNLKGEVTVTPRNRETTDILKAQGNFLLLDPSLKETKAFICRFSPLLPLDALLALPNVVSANRWVVRKDTPTSKVLVTFRGPVPERVTLGSWGSFPTAKYHLEPLRCFNCQRFGHHKARCTLPVRCGVCSGKHETDICLQKFKAGQQTTPKCPNCQGPHHAWFKGCRVRLERMGTTSSATPPKAEHKPQPQLVTPKVTSLVPRSVQLRRLSGSPPATASAKAKAPAKAQAPAPAPPPAPRTHKQLVSFATQTSEKSVATSATQTAPVLSKHFTSSGTQTNEKSVVKPVMSDAATNTYLEETQIYHHPREVVGTVLEIDSFLVHTLNKHLARCFNIRNTARLERELNTAFTIEAQNRYGADYNTIIYQSS